MENIDKLTNELKDNILKFGEKQKKILEIIFLGGILGLFIRC